jgi:DNA replication ATP-dependent helicase Dna2
MNKQYAQNLTIQSLIESIPSIPSNITSEQRATFIYSLLDPVHHALTILLKDELQLFASVYASWTFLIQKYPQFSSAKKIYGQLKSLIKQHTYDDETLNLAIKYVTTILHILQGNIVQSVANMYRDEEYKHIYQENQLAFFRGIILSIENTSHHNERTITELVCENNDGHIITIALFDSLATQSLHFWIGATIHLFSLHKNHQKDHYYYSGSQTLMVLEPDILVSATEIAECVQQNAPKGIVAVYFLKKFLKKSSSKAMLSGTIIGNWLDELLAKSVPDSISTIYYKSIQYKPLQTISIINNEQESQDLLKEIEDLSEIMQEQKQLISADFITTEAAFLSPAFGLNGRLDILLEYQNDPLHKTIVELKSGRTPSVEHSVMYDNHFVIKTGAWPNHTAQVACYNLLLDAAFPGRSGDSRLLYAKASNFPLRNVPNIFPAKRDVLSIRNSIIAIEHAIMQRKFQVFEHMFHSSTIDSLPSFMQFDAGVLSKQYFSLQKIETLYVLALVSFIMREHFVARTGTHAKKGFSSLWHEPLNFKQESMMAIGYLTLKLNDSVWESMHLEFTRTFHSAVFTSIREGDTVILYPHNLKPELGEAVKGYLYKGIVKSIDDHSIKLGIRNKQARIDHLSTENQLWAIESDNSNDSLYTGLFRSIGDFIRSNSEKKEIILGIKKPELKEFSLENIPDYLHDSQRVIYKKILQSNDYFLVQGPPGTGKTSSLIKSIVETLYHQTDESILLTAYTNRAVDELCYMLKGAQLPYIRLGSKDSTHFQEQTVYSIVDECGIEGLRNSIHLNRICVSTVSSLQTHSEIFDLKTFSTVIIDEAAQLLEPQVLGIISKVKRFIMIGDEKQLPAIVQQDARGALLNNPLLDSIECTDLRLSLFERLLIVCKKNGWTHAYDMLHYQGRMHNDINTYISKEFYDNALCIMNSNQLIQDDESILPLYNRIHWIESDIESIPKIHRKEAEKAVELAIEILDKTIQKTIDIIGIIAPFKAQIAYIQQLIPHSYKQWITVDTVERFQGSERDIIIISLAIHNSASLSMIESLQEIDGKWIDRKLNVAITRAKKQCIIIGNPKALRKNSAYWNLWDYARQLHSISSIS